MALLVLATGLGGCARKLTGHWRGVEVKGGDRRVFSLGTMEFNEDDTFKGVATIDGQGHTVAGTYRFDGMRLKLETPEGLYDYPVSNYNMFKKTLTVKRDGVKAKIERVGK